MDLVLMMRHTPRTRYGKAHCGQARYGKVRREAGYNLLEVMFAAALLFTIVVSILPLFWHSIQNTARGGYASKLASFAAGDLERVNQVAIDNPDWNLPPAGVLDLGDEYYFNSPDNSIGQGGGWSANSTGAGDLLWVRSTKIRKYAFADISAGNISTETDSEIVTLGHPQLFDRPLGDDSGGDGYKAQIVEFRVFVRPCRGCENNLGGETEEEPIGQRITVSHFRAF